MAVCTGEQVASVHNGVLATSGGGGGGNTMCGVPWAAWAAGVHSAAVLGSWGCRHSPLHTDLQQRSAAFGSCTCVQGQPTKQIAAFFSWNSQGPPHISPLVNQATTIEPVMWSTGQRVCKSVQNGSKSGPVVQTLGLGIEPATAWSCGQCLKDSPTLPPYTAPSCLCRFF